MQNEKLKVVVIGGGSSYTPELIEGFIKRYDILPITELWLVDIEDGKEKLDIIYNLTNRMFKEKGIDINLNKTLDRREALKDADFVTTQLRVGGLEARYFDESIPNKYGSLGQETNFAGGMFKAFRTIPVIFDIIDDVKELAPNAYVVNFTNPAGIVTEAVNRYKEFDKMIGVCNVPIHMKMEMAEEFNVNIDELEIDYIGLNHLVFATDVRINGTSVMQEAIEKFLNMNSTMKNIDEIPWNKNFVRGLGCLPCSYLTYFYKKEEMLGKQLKSYSENNIRSKVVMEYEKELFKKYQDENLVTKPKELENRGGAYYSTIACEVLESIYNDRNLNHAVNIKNNGSIKNLDNDYVIEVSCKITKEGAKPIDTISTVPYELKGIIEAIKSFELKTIEAAITGDYYSGLVALNLNPLTNDDDKNEKIYNELLEAHKKHLPKFYENGKLKK